MSPTYDADGQLSVGQTAPLFSLPGVDGKTYNLEDYRGRIKALGVIFWCNHCPYVIKSEERMISLAKRYDESEVQFLMICANNAVTHPQDSFDNMKVRARQKSYPFPYLRDESQEVTLSYGAKTTPHVFLFDGDLKLAFRGAIDDNVDNPGAVRQTYLKDAVDALLAGRPDDISQAVTREVGCSIKWK